MIKRPLDKLDADSFAIKIEHSGIHFYIKVSSLISVFMGRRYSKREGGRDEDERRNRQISTQTGRWCYYCFC